MATYALDKIRDNSSENNVWGLDLSRGSGSGSIRTLDEVADINALLAMELAAKFLADDALSNSLDGTQVFHVIEGETFFNHANYKMFQRLMKHGQRYSIVTWKPILDQ